MAFMCATGKHRKPGRVKRTTATAAGVAALTTGVVGTLAAAPALAADNSVENTGLTPVIAVSDTLADEIAAQATAQKAAAERKAAE
ncbi:M23 family peptidase, partial [Streptomyces sp. SID2999]|nr:M23 family peptidase [Streptomyces sp. SID2999]